MAAEADTTARTSIATRPTQLTRLEHKTGLTVSIDSVRPAAIQPGDPIQLKGDVTNVGTTRWRDAQVYLEISTIVATTRAELEVLGGPEDVSARRIVKFGLFDQIGPVRPGTTKPYRLKIPYSELQISATAGVHRIEVSVVAGNRQGRDVDNPVARAQTLMPLSPDPDAALEPTRVVTLVPITFPVVRHIGGSFVDERLTASMSGGGQLRHLLDFVERAPPDTLELVADPALLDAVADMANGYSVAITGQDSDGRGAGRPGIGQEVANQWLADFDEATTRQGLLLTAWALPDASGFARANMPAVVEAAVTASEVYAASRGLPVPVVNWQSSGAATRRGLVVARSSGADLQVVAEDNLVNLGSAPGSQYPPSLVQVPTSQGALTTTVYARTISGRRLDADVGALTFRQSLMSEATVRALDAQKDSRLWVVATPFGWDPGPAADSVRLFAGYGFATVMPVDLASTDQDEPTNYPGPIALTAAQPQIPESLVVAVGRYVDSGRTVTELLTDRAAAVAEFQRRLAAAGTSQWASQPALRLALVRHATRLAVLTLRRVTVTGPPFVALSSATGKFPLTVTNGLQVGVDVRVNVRPGNPALRIEPIEPLRLAPGESVDIEASTSSDKSGVTQVRVRLATTTTDRAFGAPYEFDVRATQIGVAIWIVIAVGSAVVLIAAVLQIIRRIRTTGLAPREKPSP